MWSSVETSVELVPAAILEKILDFDHGLMLLP
jgi:hypothetical protein